jgi:hypothetical protein
MHYYHFFSCALLWLFFTAYQSKAQPPNILTGKTALQGDPIKNIIPEVHTHRVSRG